MSDANTDETTFAAAARAAVRLDVKCRNLESQNQALQEERDSFQRVGIAWQERAEKAEARAHVFEAWATDYQAQRDDALVALALIQATDCDTLKPTHHDIATRALSPTQETDRPIRCQSRCDQYPNCQHDWRSWHTRPTQETDPG